MHRMCLMLKLGKRDLLFCFLFAAVRLSLDADYLTDGIQGDTLKYKAYRLQAQVYM